MGSSLLFKTVNTGAPAPFEAPEWAAKLDNDFFYKEGRRPNDVRGGYWWIEIGVPWHTIHENEDIRHQLTRYVLGVWDWIKNKDPNTKELAANHAIDWIGQVPGKRESRRIQVYLMTEHDPMNRTVFDDEIAYGGWFLVLHTPGGLLAPTSPAPSAWTNYSVESKLKVDSWHDRVGLIARYQNASNYYYMSYSGYYHTVSLVKYQNGADTTLASATLSADPASGAYHTFRMEVDGSSIKGYIDGVLLVSGTSIAFTSGQAGVYSHMQKTYFDDFIVEKL